MRQPATCVMCIHFVVSGAISILYFTPSFLIQTFINICVYKIETPWKAVQKYLHF